jgi:hypothetical protein
MAALKSWSAGKTGFGLSLIPWIVVLLRVVFRPG